IVSSSILPTGVLPRQLSGLRLHGLVSGSPSTLLKAIELHHALSHCTSLGGKHVIAAHGCDVNATVHKSTLNQYGVLVRFSDLVSVTRFNTTILGVHGSVHFRRYIAWSFTGVSGAATPAHIASRLVPPTA